jgi:hypothetical protein
LNPGDDFLVLRVGKAYLDMENKDKALEYFERYISMKGRAISPEERREVEDLIQRCKQL